MTESQAWRILAKEHDAGESGSKYLCFALDKAVTPALAAIPAAMRRAMVNRMRLELDNGGIGAYETHEPRMSNEEQKESRVLACLMLSQITKDEEGAK